MSSPVDRQSLSTQAAAAVPGQFCNRFYVFAGPVVKLAFMEASPVGGSERPCAAVVMTLEDAKQLHGVLGDVLQKAQQNQGSDPLPTSPQPH